MEPPLYCSIVCFTSLHVNLDRCLPGIKSLHLFTDRICLPSHSSISLPTNSLSTQPSSRENNLVNRSLWQSPCPLPQFRYHTDSFDTRAPSSCYEYDPAPCLLEVSHVGHNNIWFETWVFLLGGVDLSGHQWNPQHQAYRASDEALIWPWIPGPAPRSINYWCLTVDKLHKHAQQWWQGYFYSNVAISI